MPGLLMKLKWALIVQNTNEFGGLWIAKVFPYDQQATCEQIAAAAMKTYQWMEAACFLVH